MLYNVLMCYDGFTAVCEQGRPKGGHTTVLLSGWIWTYCQFLTSEHLKVMGRAFRLFLSLLLVLFVCFFVGGGGEAGGGGG